MAAAPALLSPRALSDLLRMDSSDSESGFSESGGEYICLCAY